MSRADIQARYDDVCNELDQTYAMLRALALGSVQGQDAWKAAVVGLLPEVQPFAPEVEAQMRERGMGHLVDRQNDLVAENWRKFYPGSVPKEEER